MNKETWNKKRIFYFIVIHIKEVNRGVIFIFSAFTLFLSTSLYYLFRSNEKLLNYGFPIGVFLIFIISMIITIKIVNKHQMGQAIYLLYLPFINTLAFFWLIIPLISFLRIPMFDEQQDLALGIRLWMLIPIHWLLFIVSVIVGHLLS